MDICVYVHVNKVIRCEYNKRGRGGVGGCVGGGASEIRQTWGGACPKRLKTPVLVYIHNICKYFSKKILQLALGLCFYSIAFHYTLIHYMCYASTSVVETILYLSYFFAAKVFSLARDIDTVPTHAPK